VVVELVLHCNVEEQPNALGLQDEKTKDEEAAEGPFFAKPVSTFFSLSQKNCYHVQHRRAADFRLSQYRA
jgi:hypothetical protein